MTSLVIVCKVLIFVRNFANVVQTVQIDFLDADAKHSATPNNAHVFWLCENVTQIYAQNVELINMMSQRSLVETYLFRLVFIFYAEDGV